MKVKRHEIESDAALKLLQDKMYELSKSGDEPFYDLVEMMKSTEVIISAVHHIKSNRGANTSGVDGQVIRDILDKPFEEIIERVRKYIDNYRPLPVKRQFIPKSNGKLRPLGIPAVYDKIIQECARLVLEPIAEGKFFPHSYGFRPMRSCEHAIARVVDLVNRGCGYVAIEGDIKGFFDHINHNKLIEILWNLGVKDKRFLMLIKKMLKAGILEEGTLYPSDVGSPQGGIISPLLANIYLNGFDWMISGMYETHPAMKTVLPKNGHRKVQKRHEPTYLVRYADDWVIICRTKEHAQRVLSKIEKYFRHRLHLELSMEKTLITDMRESPIQFLGFHISARKARLKDKLVGKPVPMASKFRSKVREILKEVKGVKRCIGSPHDIAAYIENINAKIVGLTNYYKIGICSDMFVRADHALYRRIKRTLYRMFSSRANRDPLKDYMIVAKETHNRVSRHQGLSVRLWGYKVDDVWIAFTRFSLTKSTLAYNFDQSITPYTHAGRTGYEKKYGKRLRLARGTIYAPEDLKFVALHMADSKWRKKNGRLYNFEFVMNREYAYNRDKGCCKACKCSLDAQSFHCHHISPWLSNDIVNKVSNLASVCTRCHNLIHSNSELDHSKPMMKIKKYREKLIKDNS
ncbi:MAG: group II intron reverse transcriptase/maturase [Tumebacillaceae bacterium]